MTKYKAVYKIIANKVVPVSDRRDGELRLVHFKNFFNNCRAHGGDIIKDDCNNYYTTSILDTSKANARKGLYNIRFTPIEYNLIFNYITKYYTNPIKLKRERKKLEKIFNDTSVDLYSKLKFINKDKNLYQIFFYNMDTYDFYYDENILDKELNNLHTVLIAAIALDYKEFAKQIISVATDQINNSDEDGYTALYQAVSKNDLDLVELLVKKGATSSQGKYSATYLAYMLKNRNGDSILKCLLENKIDLDFKDIHGETLLERAIKDKNEEVINLLKEEEK
ncbi:MAG: ankyrin repeat domain-containing protein [Candidatus Omnitrophica bacterium]|nr:ankyrin repeat domain-containing protein [Candidatus Omnitrophota bacterium]